MIITAGRDKFFEGAELGIVGCLAMGMLNQPPNFVS